MRFAALALSLSVAAACADPLPESAAAPCDQARRVRDELYPDGPRTEALEAAVAAKVIPGGFGGLYQDLLRGVLVVGLVDPTVATEAVPVLTELLSCGAIYPGWLGHRLSVEVVEIRRVDFRADSLLSWFTRVGGLGADDGVWATEIDPLTNRIWIGLEAPGAVAPVAAVLNSAGVPIGAVDLESQPPADPPGPIEALNSNLVAEDDGSGWTVAVEVMHSNPEPAAVYQGRCVIPGSQPLRSEPLYRLEKWDGIVWRPILVPVCEAILLNPPVSVAPGESRRDTVTLFPRYRLRTQPVWDNSRVAGVYQVVVPVYRSVTGSPPQLTDPFPDEYGRTAPFRLTQEPE